MDAPRLRWGIIGPGWIAERFTASLQRHTRQRVVAVGSRNSERSAQFAARHGIERSHGSHEELVADPGVDVVYVARPPTTCTIRAHGWRWRPESTRWSRNRSG